MERLLHRRALALGEAIDISTEKTYGSALNSYLTFVRIHDLPTEPTDDTLSLFTVFMSDHIQPRSVKSYLSGIVQQLEPYFPDVRRNRNSPLVKRTLRGCLRMKSTAIKRKHALTIDNLQTIINHYGDSQNHDDLLFVAMLFTGFFSLMRLGELTFPDDESIRDWRKVSKHCSVVVTPHQYEFELPALLEDDILY